MGISEPLEELCAGFEQALCIFGHPFPYRGLAPLRRCQILNSAGNDRALARQVGNRGAKGSRPGTGGRAQGSSLRGSLRTKKRRRGERRYRHSAKGVLLASVLSWLAIVPVACCFFGQLSFYIQYRCQKEAPRLFRVTPCFCRRRPPRSPPRPDPAEGKS